MTSSAVGKNPTARFGLASFWSVGTMCRCIVGLQSQLFRSLCFLLKQTLGKAPEGRKQGTLEALTVEGYRVGNLMCGICGQYNFGNQAPVRRADIKAMTDSLAHRGPDDEGFYIAGPLGFGFSPAFHH